MMNEKSVTLRGGEKVLVQEVTVRRVMKALPFLNPKKEAAAGTEAEPEKPFIENIDELLGSVCGLTAEKLLDLYPSDLEQLWNAFREVNGFFFKMAEKLGLAEQLGTILRSILAGAGSQLADSLKSDIRAALITASAGLSVPPSTPSETEKNA